MKRDYLILSEPCGIEGLCNIQLSKFLTSSMWVESGEIIDRNYTIMKIPWIIPEEGLDHIVDQFIDMVVGFNTGELKYKTELMI